MIVNFSDKECRRLSQICNRTVMSAQADNDCRGPWIKVRIMATPKSYNAWMNQLSGEIRDLALGPGEEA